MSSYTPTIQDAIVAAGYPHHADEATAILIEDCMRTNRSGLDHLTREDFTVEVGILIQDLTGDPEATRNLCDLLGFTEPTWLNGAVEQLPVLPWAATRKQILAVLEAAFPGVTFALVDARGHGAGHVLIRWEGGPRTTSVDDAVAQFLPSDDHRIPARRYGIVQIFTCRLAPIAHTQAVLSC